MEAGYLSVDCFELEEAWSLVQQKVVQEALSWHQDTTEYKNYESGNTVRFRNAANYASFANLVICTMIPVFGFGQPGLLEQWCKLQCWFVKEKLIDRARSCLS
ncbi:hypothetical protein MKW98_029497 [Papaver atlanticum]|uniref:Uncharacterized protein n=1 Tax=Papaver atlanticum TaxID=357466 RepID=A0AAD4SIN4_9MAGN|nr:hypothetical protein MKW98_029497 [Papaver atlanticum]